MKLTPIQPRSLEKKLSNLWKLSGQKIQSLDKTWKASDGSPVFTVAGRYTSKGWTEWTQGFQFGMAILQFDATGDESFLEIGRRHTLNRMAPHLTPGEPPRPCLCAFGSPEPEGFTPNMGCELAAFLARVVERMAERWPVLN